MTPDQMRALLGLGPEVSDADVVAAYAIYLENQEGAVKLDDARRQLRMEPSDTSRDIELQQYIDDALSWVEGYTGHKLAAGDVIEEFSCFGRLQLRAWPIKPDASVIVEFADGANASIIVDGARVSAAQRPAVVLPAIGTRWPPVGAGVVTVTVRAGYEAGDTVPGNLRRAALILITAFDEDREGGELFAAAEVTASNLCRRYRRHSA